MNDNDIIKPHVGKTIRDITWDKEHLTIELDDGAKVIGWALGDCCAVTNIVEVAGWDDWMKGRATLAGVERHDFGSYQAQRSDQTDVFATIIKTKNVGDIIALCTCEHNGYYSGWLGFSTA